LYARSDILGAPRGQFKPEVPEGLANTRGFPVKFPPLSGPIHRL